MRLFGDLARAKEVIDLKKILLFLVLAFEDCEDGGISCDNLLSLIQFTKSLQHWISTSLCLRKDKSKVANFWVQVTDLVLASNCHHIAVAMCDALQENMLQVLGKVRASLCLLFLFLV